MTKIDLLDDDQQRKINQAMHENKLASLHGCNFVLTGTMSMPRADMVAFISLLGGHVSNTVTKATTVVIAADPHGSSHKIQEARRLGIPVFGEDDFALRVRKGGSLR